MESDDTKPSDALADWVDDPVEGQRYAWIQHLTHNMDKYGFTRDEQKNIYWSIMAESGGKMDSQEKGGGSGHGLIQLSGDANKKLYSKKISKVLGRPVDMFDPKQASAIDVQAELVPMYFKDRDLGKGYTDFSQVHRAIAPRDRNPQHRIDWLNKQKIRPPEDTDFMIHTLAQ